MSDIVYMNNADISSSDITSSEYAHKGRELMKLVNDLCAMGYVVLLLPLLVIWAECGHHSARGLIDLPSIVVIGG
jgi:hypothetical protein